MARSSNEHIINSQEIQQLLAMGYKILYNPPPAVENLIMHEFSGFEPLSFAIQIERLLGHLTTQKLERHMVLATPPPKLQILFYSEDYRNDHTGLLFMRTFTQNNVGLCVTHDYLVIPELYRGSGVGKKVLSVCLDQYIKMNVKKIFIHAGLKDGGYVWAKAGFKAVDRSEVDYILDKAKLMLTTKEYTQVENVYKDHYNSFPDSSFEMEHWAMMQSMVPILRGSNWHGEIDLSNSFELSNFINYVSRSNKI